MSPSGSVACKVIETGGVLVGRRAAACATGRVVDGLTVIVIVAVFDPRMPSLAAKVKVSGPE